MFPVQPQAEPAERPPAMGTCSEDPHLGRASWLLGFTSILLSVCGAMTQSSGVRGSGVEDSGIPVSLKRTQGDSVLFHVIRSPELPPGVELEKMSWGIALGSNWTAILQVIPESDVPEWFNFQDKFEKRVHVFNTTTLRIDNLTLEDSGLYRARVCYSKETQTDQDFPLTVYAPVPLPQIRATVPSLTPGWCNVTVECDTTGTRENLTVSWESEGLPREQEQRPSVGPAPNPWTLAVTLPLSQPNASLTCVVSNQMDQKTATRVLGDVCGHETDRHGQTTADPLPGILVAVAIVLLILGAGLYLWKRRGEKKNVDSGRGAGSQEEHRDPDGDILYAELSQRESADRRDRGRGAPDLEEENPLTTVYSEVSRPGQATVTI
ncbi:SLAM family member 6-like isoform X2 [Ursus maritimus]|uniref:SLAM family member 6-like isoform X2 n=2 Tax=Ursus maritimus TaxID=29073 RepID=A0A8M1G818_URSMA|nr:SLAM family member 6-like isoform X2 [Ursus maritimus]